MRFCKMCFFGQVWKKSGFVHFQRSQACPWKMFSWSPGYERSTCPIVFWCRTSGNFDKCI